MFEKQTLLHVEDDEAVAFIVRHVLRKQGFSGRYQCVAGVDEAIAYFSRQGHFADPNRYPTPTVVLANSALASGRGARDLIVWLRKQPEYTRTPIMVLTGRLVDRSTQERMKRAGVNAFIAKGRELPEMADELQAAFRKCGVH